MNLPARINKLEARATAVRAIPCPRQPVRTPSDVVELLAMQIEAVRRDPQVDPVEKARTIGLLASIVLRAMGIADGEERLEAIEQVLKLRRDAQRSDRGQ